jgi:crotonobetainyl-CoA:carnitine CoA-transferase CaiB-like acyl-CoA transferase
MSTELIIAISTGIVGPILAYLKVREERLKTSDKREAQFAMLDKRITDAESKIDDLQELKESIGKINITLSRIETILEMYMKGHTL